MLRLHLEHYITLGKNMAGLRRMLDDGGRTVPVITRNGRRHELDPTQAVVLSVGQLRDACARLGLNVAVATIDRTMSKGLGAPDQIETLLDTVESELENQLFLHVPSDRAKYWESDGAVSGIARNKLPVASSEIRAAGTAYACGLWNASVFHAMRAAEDALRAVASELEIELNGAEQWGNIIDRIESELTKIAKLPKATEKKRLNLQPLSDIVQDLRVFKDAWRNQSVHNVVSYNDGQALNVFSAVCRVLEKVAIRVS